MEVPDYRNGHDRSASVVPLDLNVVCNTPDAEIFANIRRNSRLSLPWVQEKPTHDRVAVLVGGGPSLADTFVEIVVRARAGQKVFALNGTAKWLGERDLVPDCQVVMDSRAKNVEFVKGSPAKEFYLSSQCHPDLFDELDDRPVTLFHPVLDGIMEHIGAQTVLLGGGITVGLSAMSLVYALGFRECHLFGYDSSDREGDGHAYVQEESEPERRKVEVWCCGKPFVGQPALIAQAQAFPKWARLMADHGMVVCVHGSGLLPTIAHEMVRLEELELAKEPA